jgi:hypothetical protein
VRYEFLEGLRVKVKWGGRERLSYWD